MLFSKKTAGASALATLLLSTTALADVTARDVWESWRSYLSGTGYDISASESTQGGTLTVSNLSMSMNLPEEEGQVAIDMGMLQFVEKGDGTVEVVLPNPTPMRIHGTGDGEDFDVTLTLTHTGMSTIVSGTAGEMAYTYSAAQLGMDLTSLIVNGEQVPGMTVDIDMDALLGRSTMVMGDQIQAAQQGSIDRVAYVFSGSDPDSGDKVDVRGSINGLQIEAEAVVPEGDYSDDPAAMFANGFAVAAQYVFDDSEFALNFSEDGAPGVVNATSGAGTMDIVMNAEVMSYGGAVADMALNMMGPDIPLPIDISFGEFGYGFDIPMQASPDQQDFALGLALVDLSVSEMIWGMIDPGQALPHDPATLVIDLAGKATIFKDLMSLDEDMDDVPGEVNALTLADLQLRIAGAELTGAGDFTFDNTDLASFDGMPRPEGALNLRLMGANALMDKLVAMGLLPEEQAMGARMMMSMFAVPAGEDELTSTIEVNDQGHVLANGQRLK